MKRNLCIGLSLSHRLVLSKKSVTSAYIEDLVYQIDMAQQAEQAKLDFVFKADSMVAHPSKNNVGIDPTIFMSILSQSTASIGLVTTISTSFMPPYVLARQLASLQWLSNGRAGWNIVTSIDGFENFGFPERPPTKLRYEMAKEASALVTTLLESYKEGQEALPIEHKGKYFEVKGPLNVAAHPSGRMPLFQAGASELGRNFAASVADAIFAATPTMYAALDLRQNLQHLAVTHGRKAEEIRILPGCYFFVARTRKEAEQMYIEAHSHITEGGKFKKIEELLGTSLESRPLTDRITIEQLPPIDKNVRSRTHSILLREFVVKEEPTVREILNRPEVLHSAHWVVYGTPLEVADEITKWYDAEALDGLIAIPGGKPQSLHYFLEEVIPILVTRGLFRKEYDGNTLQKHLQIHA